jgi:tRNA(Ile)-lysidine synthase
VLARITRTISRNDMFHGVRRLGVAVSGGADSICLLHALIELAPAYGISLVVLHADHGLRAEESRADAAFVRDLAGRLGIPFRIRELHLDPAKGNFEERARRARLAFFADQITAGEVDRVATGHTRSDQAETVLYRLLRGAGPGLAGVRPVTSTGLVRPLLEISRGEVREFLRERGLVWREDSTNRSIQFARNRIRLELLPQLEREWNPQIEEVLARTAEWAAAEEAWWNTEIARLEAAHFMEVDGAIVMKAEALSSLSKAVVRRLVRRAIERVKGDLRAIGFEHLEAVLDIVRKPEGGAVCLPGVTVCRSFDWVRFGLPSKRSQWRVSPVIPGATPEPGAAIDILLEITDKSKTSSGIDCVYNIEMGCLDWKWISTSPVLRTWQPGDRYQPIGACGDKKLKTLFQEARIPVWERAGWPVLEVENRIIWSRRFGPAAWCAADSSTRVVLCVREVTR